MVQTDSPHASTQQRRMVVGLSSRVLFALEDSHRVYTDQGAEAYRQYQMEHEDEILAPGFAFPLVQKLDRLDRQLSALNSSVSPPEHEICGVEVVLLSRNTPDAGLRAFNSIVEHRLPIKRAAFCGGESPHRYLNSLGCDLFLSAEKEDVIAALNAGVAAAHLRPHSNTKDEEEGPLRFAFDADSVVFSDQADQVFDSDGIEGFRNHEDERSAEPLPGGPFQGFLQALAGIQRSLDSIEPDSRHKLLRTALFTARDAPAHKRVIRTLRRWDIRVDETLFLGGQGKGAFLRDFKADFFFDDKEEHCLSARNSGVAAGLVPASESTTEAAADDDQAQNQS